MGKSLSVHYLKKNSNKASGKKEKNKKMNTLEVSNEP